jgi:hypothetical protein
VVTLRDHPVRLTSWVKHCRWGLGGPSLPGLSPTREVPPMVTTSTSTAVAVAESMVTEPERRALAGFLAGYAGLTREAYALDLRQFASWCQRHQARLFQARRAGIECFARDLEARGRARATITPAAVHHRRVLQVRSGGRVPRSLPGGSCPPAPPGL